MDGLTVGNQQFTLMISIGYVDKFRINIIIQNAVKQHNVNVIMKCKFRFSK